MLTKHPFTPPQNLTPEGQRIVNAVQEWIDSVQAPGGLTMSGPTIAKAYIGNNLSDNGTDDCAIWMNQQHTNPALYGILDGGVLTYAPTSQPSANAAITSALDRWNIIASSTLLGATMTLTVDEANCGTHQLSAFADTGRTLNLTLARAYKIHGPTKLGSGTMNVTTYHGLDIEDQKEVVSGTAFATTWGAIRLANANPINVIDKNGVTRAALSSNTTGTNGEIVLGNSSMPLNIAALQSGSWTPVFTFGTPGNLAVTYTTQSGSYVKIGQLVIAHCNILTSAFTHTTAAGVAVVTGLPYSAGTQPLAVGGSMIFRGITKATYTTVSPGVATTTNYVIFTASGSGVAPSNVSFGDMPTGGTVELDFTVIYTV